MAGVRTLTSGLTTAFWKNIALYLFLQIVTHHEKVLEMIYVQKIVDLTRLKKDFSFSLS